MADRPAWTFITSHGFMLLAVSRNSDATVRELAEQVGVTERQAHRVLSDLAAEDYIVRERVGRRNRYRINDDAPMRLQSLSHHSIGELLTALRAP